MPLKNKVQLITYPDSLGGDLKALNDVLATRFRDIFQGGVHLLPPFPSSGDRGFAPLTYLEIEPAFGTWDDVKRIGERHDLLVDLMVNHISRKSAYFQDFLARGRESEHADLFLTLDKIWPDGKPNQADIDKIFLRRKRPYSTFRLETTGEEVSVWTTFGREDPSEQIDLDIRSEKVTELLTQFFANFRDNHIRIVRLDAVGFVIKRLGTSCFFVEPDIFDFLEKMKGIAETLGIELLPEVHAHYDIQLKLSDRGYWIYDFILPFTVLEAMLTGSAERLKHYLRVRPHRQFTMLDCHDGVPVLPDLRGFIDVADARRVVDVCVSRGSTLSLIVADEHKGEGGFDVHQIGGTYYEMLGRDDELMLAARAIQLFAPGIPQVYYVGLLAGENDYEAVQATGENRAMNRHNYSLEEIDAALSRHVVQRLLALIRFRNEHPAFDGEFTVLDSAPHEVQVEWTLGEARCTLSADLASKRTIIDYTDENGAAAQLRV